MSTVGTKNYNGQDWFWPHDYRHYLRDANARQRKLIHNGWLKIGVPVKKSGLKISDRYLEPKKNQLKKAWAIVRKVVAPKELGMPIPESVNESKAEKEKIFNMLVKRGDTPVDARYEVDKSYDFVKKRFSRASVSKKAEIISALSKYESVKKEGKYEVYFDVGSPGLMSQTVNAKNEKEAAKMVARKLKGGAKLIRKVVKEGTCGYGVDGKLGEEPAGPQLLKKKKKFDLDEACQKGYMTHPTRKTKIMFGKRYRNCVKKEGVDTTMTLEQAGRIMDDICVNCGDFANENLRKWFSDRWVNIGKKKKGGGHPPCGTSGKKRGYAKCVPASKAAGMSKKQKASATRRKRAAQNKAGRGGTSNLRGGGKKPIRVSTKPKK